MTCASASAMMNSGAKVVLALFLVTMIPGAFLFGLLLESVGRFIESCSYMSAIFALGLITMICKFLNRSTFNTKHQQINQQHATPQVSSPKTSCVSQSFALGVVAFICKLRNRSSIDTKHQRINQHHAIARASPPKRPCLPQTRHATPRVAPPRSSRVPQTTVPVLRPSPRTTTARPMKSASRHCSERVKENRTSSASPSRHGIRPCSQAYRSRVER